MIMDTSTEQVHYKFQAFLKKSGMLISVKPGSMSTA